MIIDWLNILALTLGELLHLDDDALVEEDS